MKRLTLIRHAKSSWKDNTLADFDRPLNKRGLRDAPRMGALLRNHDIVPEVILSSPARRAATTANLLARALGVPNDHVRLVKAIYGADLPTLYYLVHSLDDTLAHVAIVGHNPAMHWLCTDLTGTALESFVTCAVADLALDVEDWGQVVPGTGRLLHFLTPRDTRSNQALG